jgi:hypothetical protein
MMPTKRASDGTSRTLGWTSPFTAPWLWHVLFDGTRVCHCKHSRQYRALLRSRKVSR